MLERWIDELLDYGLKKQLMNPADRIYNRNLLLDAFSVSEYAEDSGFVPKGRNLEEILADLLDKAFEMGIIEDDIVSRDLFDTRLMNCLLPKPSDVRRRFEEIYRTSPEDATDYYYRFSMDSDYIRRYRIEKDIKWKVDTEFGEMDITINLSKPEKDPKAIAASKNAVQSGYPKCLLCMENEGYAGRMNHPARQNLRLISLRIDESDWFMQYSPYVYYNEHCILFNARHTPMKIDKSTFQKLFDFIKQFPHYILGSNADLPIVGGSILSHDHFQGGRYTFPMLKAKALMKVEFKGFEDVRSEIVHWPMSVLRLCAEDADRIIALSDRILRAWRDYTDESAMIFSETNGEPHNTITPIANKIGGDYVINLVLRNNLTTAEHPDGLYHPNAKLHHIKKENIGLIEVMGLAILPSRLKTELEMLSHHLVNGLSIRDNESIAKHADWADELRSRYVFTPENVEEILRKEVGTVFKKVLEDAGVYKCTVEGREAFLRFVEHVNRIADIDRKLNEQ